MSLPSQPFPAVLDPFHPFLAADTLSDALRSVPDVPDAQYLARDGKVFVFSLLHDLVDAQGRGPDGQIDPKLVARLIPQAWVDPEHAVNSFGVAPSNSALVELEGAVAILHKPFDALLPVRYASKAEGNQALAKLLVGEVIEGKGDFSYRGQPMTLRHPFSVSALPASPHLDAAPQMEAMPASPKVIVPYQPQFTAITRETYAALVEAHDRWVDSVARAHEHARTGSAHLWRHAKAVEVAQLNNPTDAVPPHATEEALQLRIIYPELPVLSDGSLYAWFREYQFECVAIRGNWTPARDSDFLFFLLGRACLSRTVEGAAALRAGLFAGYALQLRAKVATALTFARQCMAYDVALQAMAQRAFRVMRFVAEDQAADPLRGPPITTTADRLRKARSAGLTGKATAPTRQAEKESQ